MFQRVGESTDIVRKEMYDFEDKGGRHLALRPEGTASVVRAFVEHRPPTPWKVWYVGAELPLRAARRPAATASTTRSASRSSAPTTPTSTSRSSPSLDGFYRALGLRAAHAACSTRIGDAGRPARLRRRAAGATSTRTGDAAVRAEPRRRSSANPLRVLDSKRPEDAPVVAAAPARARLPRRRRGGPLRAGAGGAARRSASPFEIDAAARARARLLHPHARSSSRPHALDAAQNAIGGGGRYDGLVEQLGGPPTPGIGFGSGIERILLACDAEGVFAAPDADGRRVRGRHHRRRSRRSRSPHELRAGGHRAPTGRSTARSMKAQMKAADRSGAALALIVGAGRARRRRRSPCATCVATGAEGEPGQQAIPRQEVIDYVRKSL